MMLRFETNTDTYMMFQFETNTEAVSVSEQSITDIQTEMFPP